MNVIEHHPHMILKKDDFSCIVINWGDKVQNMREITKQLNIGMDSLVFFDDDAVNREYVRRELPQVRSCRIAASPAPGCAMRWS